MALETNYYKLTFDNKQEYIIGHKNASIGPVLKQLGEGLLNDDYIEISYKGNDPIFIKKSRLFSIQKQSKETIGTQTRVWVIK